jgi:uncharacterized protein YegL
MSVEAGFLMWRLSMFARNSIWAVGLVPLILSLNACGDLTGGGGSKKRGTPPRIQTNTTSIPTTQAPDSPVCAPNQKSIGANIAFLVDNSSSNAATDCPSATVARNINGADMYRCGQETNREKAVLAAFDLLADVSARDSSPMAASNMSIVAFPAEGNAVQTVKIATNGWVSSRPAAENRTGIQTAMQFARDPFGATPYGTAIAAAAGLFSANSNDGRAKLAVLVTDGEPTDRDPAEVSDRAKALRASGVEIVTIFVGNSQTRSQRQAAHAQMLQSYDQRSQPGHYYNAQRYQTFDAYLDDILGRNGRVPLVDAVTSQVVPTCVDSQGSVCQRWKVEIANSGELPNAVKQVLRTRAIKCQ